MLITKIAEQVLWMIWIEIPWGLLFIVWISLRALELIARLVTK